jgi:hypothetical protein
VFAYPGAYGIENCALPNSGGAMGATTSFPFNSSFTNGASVYLLQGMDKVSYLYRSKCSRGKLREYIYIYIYIYTDSSEQVHVDGPIGPNAVAVSLDAHPPRFNNEARVLVLDLEGRSAGVISVDLAEPPEPHPVVGLLEEPGNILVFVLCLFCLFHAEYIQAAVSFNQKSKRNATPHLP